MLSRIFANWNRHNDYRLGAALAFYTVLSLSPLLLLSLAIAAFFFDRNTVSQEITNQVQQFVGEAGVQVIQSTLSSAQTNSAGAASLLSILVLLFGASNVFAELRASLNAIWEVEETSGNGIMAFAREKIFAFGMVLAVGFLLVATLIFTAVLTSVSTYVQGIMPIPAPAAFALEIGFSLIGVGAVFGLIFRYVPSIHIPWKQALVGGLITSLLFDAGKYAIVFYLAKAAPGSAYGAAGSLVVFILWVYYTAQIFFLGAEFTREYAKTTVPVLARVPPAVKTQAPA